MVVIEMQCIINTRKNFGNVFVSIVAKKEIFNLLFSKNK